MTSPVANSPRSSVNSVKAGPRIYSVRSVIDNLSESSDKSEDASVKPAGFTIQVGDKLLVVRRAESVETQKSQKFVKSQKNKRSKVMKLSDLPSGEFEEIFPQVPDRIRVQ